MGTPCCRPADDNDNDDHQLQQEIYSKLDKLFGSRTPHEKMNSNGVVVIDPEKPNSVNVADREHPHQPHTDETYVDAPSRIITLVAIQ